MTTVICKIYDNSLALVHAFSGFESLLRTRRYRNPGDFKLRIPADPLVISALFSGMFIVFSDDKSAYLIESIEPDINYPNGFTIVSGRDLRGLYAYRVVWKMQTVSGTAWNRMYWLLHYNAVAPEYTIRALPFVQELEREGDAAGESGKSQYTGDNLLAALTDILGTGNFGWRSEMDIDAKSIRNIFYSGSDKTSSVVFNDVIGNLSAISYAYDLRDSANAALVGGEGEGTSRRYQAIELDSSSGFARREMYVDARDVQSSSTDAAGNETTLSEADYISALRARGTEKLSSANPEQALSFEVSNLTFVYGTHYNLGDLVTVKNYQHMGISAVCRVVAVQISDNDTGRQIEPEFEVVSMEVNTT